jgi:hypothetical protein
MPPTIPSSVCSVSRARVNFFVLFISRSLEVPPARNWRGDWMKPLSCAVPRIPREETGCPPLLLEERRLLHQREAVIGEKEIPRIPHGGRGQHIFLEPRGIG